MVLAELFRNVKPVGDEVFAAGWVGRLYQTVQQIAPRGAPLIITTPYAINASIHCRSAPSSASTFSNENSFSTPPNPAAPQTAGSGRYHSRRYRSVSAPRKLLPKSHPNSYTERPCTSPSPHCTSSERPPSSTPTRTTFTPSTSNRAQSSTRLVEPPWKHRSH
uniref:Uncharacterized protein n=1 Tax=Anopheles melas TaxID=34690 RepID=A0A182TGH3_9DIPT